MLRAGEGRARRRQLVRRLGELRAAADRLDRHRFDHQLLALVDEAEARFVRGLERGFHRGERAAACLGSTPAAANENAGTTSAVSVPA